MARERGPGRASLDETVELIAHLGRENRSGGCIRIQGELRTLQIRFTASAIWRVLRSHGIGPAPRGERSWKEFLAAPAKGILAPDFFTVVAINFTELYVLFVIELETRPVHILDVTEHPTGPFITQLTIRVLVLDIMLDAPLRLRYKARRIGVTTSTRGSRHSWRTTARLHGYDHVLDDCSASA